jgi:hypothetical protein
MKTCVLMLGCLLATASLAQSTSRREVYEWKDADGVTHYSDQPSPGARKIVLVGSTPTTVEPAATPAAPATKPVAGPPATEYSRLEIWSPQAEESFFGTDSEVVVRIRSEPSLGTGDRLLTYVDGKLLSTEDVYEHRLTSLPRGAHSIFASIVDAKGTEVIRSQPVTIYIKQPVVDNPRNKGPAARPPQPQPKPAGG